MSQSGNESDTRRVVILVTKASHGKKCDARVAIMNDHRLLTRMADHPSVENGVFNRTAALEHFGNARVRSREEAVREAGRIAEEKGLSNKSPHMFVCESVNFPSRPRPSVRASRHASPPGPTTDS